MLNKKLLAAAIVGTLAAGNAAAANLSAPNGAIPAYFAKEIIATPAAPVTLTTTAAGATLQWNIGYNFSALEVRYARLECSDTIELDAGSVTISNPGNANIGSINGAGTNVLTFSLTSTGANITESDVLTLNGDHTILSTDSAVTCSVGLYDQPSQAQVGGTNGLIAGSHFSGAYIAFSPSYRIGATATTHTASVEATPTFGAFVPSGVSNTTQAFLGAISFTYGLVDPDGNTGLQTATLGVTGVPVTLATLLAGTTTLEVDGDFSITANTSAPAFGGAALGRVVLPTVGNASALTASKATFNVGNAGFTGSYVQLTRRTPALAIPEATYTATLKAVAAQPSVYAVNDLTATLGRIVRDGTQLQAPLVQVPGGWISRLVLTNTSAIARPYTITVLSETGNTVSTNNLTGTIPANGTYVVEDLNTVLTGFTGPNKRATLNVSVAGPNTAIQGLYQIVNPDKGSISNHVLVRPGTN